MKHNKTLIKKAFLEAYDKKLDSIPEDEEIDWVPSVSYLKSMKKIVSRQKQFFWKFYNTVPKRIALIAIIVSILFGCVMSNAMDSIVHFVIRVTETFTQFFSEEIDNTVVNVEAGIVKIDKEYALSIIPEGFNRLTYDNSGSTIHTMWFNEKTEETIGLSQSLYGASIKIDTEKSSYTKIEIGGCLRYVCVNSGQIMVVWSNEEYEFLLVCPDSVDYVKLVESIKIL